MIESRRLVPILLTGIALVLGSWTAPPLSAQPTPSPNHVFSLGGSHSATAGGVVTLGMRYQNLTEDYADGWYFGVVHDPAKLTLLSVEPSHTVLTLNSGGPPSVMIHQLGSDGFVVGVVVDFYGQFMLPPGDAFLHWATYQVDLPVGDSTTLSFGNPPFYAPPVSTVVVIAGAAITPTTFPGTVYAVTPVSQYGFEFVVGTEGTIHVPTGASSFAANVTLEQTTGPTADVRSFTLAFYDLDPAPGSSDPFTAVSVEPIGILASLNGGLGPAYLTLSEWYYPDENQPGWTIDVNFDGTPPFDTSLPFATREEILRIHFEVPVPVTSPGTFHVDCGGFSGVAQSDVTVASGPSTAVVSLGCWAGTGADGNFDVIFYTPPEAEFRRGDCNTDGTFDIGDTISGLGFLFSGGLPSACESTCDTNDDGVLDIGDPISGLAVLFAGGQPLPDPGPWVCGPDPTPQGVDCLAYICP